MGESFVVNRDGSVTNSVCRNINSIDWIDFKQLKGRYSWVEILTMVICVVPVYGWGLFILSSLIGRLVNGYWPYFGIQAIENTDSPIKIYCDKNGRLGLYTKWYRITAPKYSSVQQLPTPEYPAFILEKEGKFYLYNYTQRKIRFKNSDSITYLGDNTVLVQQNGKLQKYSIIGMRIE